MNCQVCGKTASIHVTVVGFSGEKSEADYCPDHAEHAGLPADPAQAVRTREAAQQQFIAFVQANRRVPTPEEMHQMGVLDADPLRSE